MQYPIVLWIAGISSTVREIRPITHAVIWTMQRNIVQKLGKLNTLPEIPINVICAEIVIVMAADGYITRTSNCITTCVLLPSMYRHGYLCFADMTYDCGDC